MRYLWRLLVIQGTLLLSDRIIAGVLQRSGLIESERGKVRIVSRDSLEAAACNCYQITKALYAGWYSNPVPGQVDQLPELQCPS